MLTREDSFSTILPSTISTRGPESLSGERDRETHTHRRQDNETVHMINDVCMYVCIDACAYVYVYVCEWECDLCLALSAAAFSHWKARLSEAGRPGLGPCGRVDEICCSVSALRRENDSRTLLRHTQTDRRTDTDTER